MWEGWKEGGQQACSEGGGMGTQVTHWARPAGGVQCKQETHMPVGGYTRSAPMYTNTAVQSTIFVLCIFIFFICIKHSINWV